MRKQPYGNPEMGLGVLVSWCFKSARRFPAPGFVVALLAACWSGPAWTEEAAAPLPNYPPPAAVSPDWHPIKRVVFDDHRYPTMWVQDAHHVATRVADQGDFTVVDARALKGWMDAQIEKGAVGSVCVLTLGVAPDTVVEKCAPDCTLRRYLDAGGRVVWVGDVPFYYQGHAGGGWDTWERAGEGKILGFDESPWNVPGPVAITPDGAAWGLTQPDKADRPVKAEQVTVALSKDAQGHACSWFKNFNPQAPQSGFVRVFCGQVDGTKDAVADDVARVAVHGIEFPAAAEAAAGSLAIVGAESAPLFVRRGGDVRQILRVTVDNWSKKGAAAGRVHAGGKVVETPIPVLNSGRRTYELDAPVVDAPTPAAVEIVAGPATSGASITLVPRRRWTLYLDPSVHTDIGYTDYQENVLRLHNDNLDKAVKACAELPSFQWDLENAWQLEHYEEARTPEQTQALVNLIKDGHIGVSALYLNILTGACTAESFNRAALGAAVLRRRFGIRTPQAILTDVPSAVGTLPMVLAGSGVRYFAQGINQTRAPYYADPQAPPLPFWWEGPDGSRVLTWLSPTGYANAAHFQITESVESGLRHLAPHLEAFEKKKNYPYDAILLYGGVSDNQPLNPAYARVIEEWNRRYAYPRIVLAAQGQFFEYMEKTYGDRIPVLRGDNGCYWEDGAGSTAHETTLNRRSQEDIVAAEKLMSINSLLGDARPYPAAEFRRQWSNILFYIEHTWGAHNSISQPDIDFVRKQWLYKANYAKEPATVLGPMVKDGLEWIGRRVRTGDAPAVMVVNTLSWNRADVVRVELPSHLQGKKWVVTRGKTGKSLPTQRVDEKTLAFTSTAETGGIGYETYPLYDVTQAPPGDPPPPAVVRPDDHSIENRFYKVVLDPATGGIASIVDKELGRELIDPESPYKANEYLYVAGGENSRTFEAQANLPMPKFKEHHPVAVSIKAGADGPVYGSIVVESKNAFTPKIVTEIILHRDVKRIDLVNRLTKQETYAKESVYFPFPFNFRNPDVRLEIPDGVMRPEADQFGGGCRDWYAVQHWIEVCDKGGSGLPPATTGGSGAEAPSHAGDRGQKAPPTQGCRVTLSAPDSLLFCVNDLFRGKWMKKGELKIENGTLFAWAMNNYWFTNYKAGQGGDFEFRFSITSAAGLPRRLVSPKPGTGEGGSSSGAEAGGADDLAASRFGWGVANPLLGAVLPSHQQGALPAEQAFLAVDRPNAAVTSLKRAETGDGWVVRLLDLTGEGGPVKVSFPAFDFKEAALTNLVEEPVGPLEIKDHAFVVPLPKRGLATVVVK